MIVVIVGITGLVGTKIAHLLEKRKFIISEFIPVASEDSVGKTFKFNGVVKNVISLNMLINLPMFDIKTPILIFFASTTTISRMWVPILLKYTQVKIIDNSSHFRLQESVPLVIPEVNAHTISKDTRLVANPNCSTAQLAMVLHPLHNKYRIKRVVVTTFQSVSGAGNAGINQLYAERNKTAMSAQNDVFPTQIDMNCIPQCDQMDARTSYTGEEIKLQLETPKILNADIKLTATAVRVPVIGGHSESVNIEFYNEFEIDDIKQILRNFPGVAIKELGCPVAVQGEEDVWVSRIRRDYSQEKTINLWIVADNLMKGAALNAVQIGEILLKETLVS